MDKEIILHIIDGPGTVWGWIAVAFIVGCVLIVLVRTFNGYDEGFRKGIEEERRNGINEFRALLAKVAYDQQQIFKHLEYKDHSS